MSGRQAQERTKFAYEKVSGWSGQGKETATRLKGLPVEIRVGGLGTAVAVLLREDRPESRNLADLLAEWLLSRSPRRPLESSTSEQRRGDRRSLLAELARAEPSEYRAAQREALALLEQAKLLADALHDNGGDEP